MLWSGTRQIYFYLNWMGIRKIYEENTCRGWSKAFPCPLGVHYVQQTIQTGHLHCLDFAVFLATNAFPTYWQLTALFLPDRGISFSQSCSYSYSQSLSDTLLVKNDPSAVLWGRKWPLHCEKMMDGIYGMSAQGQIFVHMSAHPRACLCAHAINMNVPAMRWLVQFDLFDHRKLPYEICWMLLLNLVCKSPYLHDAQLAIQILFPIFFITRSNLQTLSHRLTPALFVFHLGL